VDWTRFYEKLERHPELLTDPGVVHLLEDRLQQIEAAQDSLEREALRCDGLLEKADQLTGKP